MLAAWRDSPARFRADANLSDDLALVGYRDRVVVELAQNAADAASRAGITGRLVVTLADDVLSAANTGAPLSTAGVESIAVTRASAKRDHPGAVGRFGVGFSAVLSVSDVPSISSSSGAVRWSRADARDLVAEIPELASELASRDGAVPVLRLPFTASPSPSEDATTVVTLPLRDADAVAAVRRQLHELDVAILLSLPALGELVIDLDGEQRVLRREPRVGGVALFDGGQLSRWLVIERSGRLDPTLLADLPVEDRGDDTWSVLVALPVTDDDRLAPLPVGIDRVVRAPTATDDRLTLPAVVVASYPLDSSRRRVTSGPLADTVAGHAGRVIAEAIRELPPHPALLALAPAGLPDGEVDAALQDAVRSELQATPWLPVAADPDIRQRPRDAVIVPDALVGPLAEVDGGVLPVGWSASELSALGASRPTIRELVEAVAGAQQPPSWWQRVYAGFDEAVPAGPERDALGGLSVPLTDGSVVTGPRGVALPADPLDEVDLGVLGVRVVHPAAAHPLLAALGATESGAAGLLELPQVHNAVEASYDGADPEPVAAAVIALVAAAGVDSDEVPWLAELALPAADGDWRPAGELLLPGGAMATLVAPDSGFGTVAAAAVDRWGADPLRAVGVLDSPALVRDLDATGPDHDLDDEAAWWSMLPAGAAVAEFVAVRDLEQLRDDAFGELVALLAVPPLRSAVVQPTVVTRADGTSLRVRSYTAWWLSSRPVLAGSAPVGLRLAAAPPHLAGLYDIAPAELDEEFLRALGVVGDLADVDPADLLVRLADESRAVDRDSLRAIYRHLASTAVAPPERVAAVRGGAILVVDASDAVIVDAPDLLPLVGERGVLPVGPADAVALAERLDVALASELATFEVLSTGRSDGDVVVHDGLDVRDADGNRRRVAWRLVGGQLHVDSARREFGIGRGTAWRDGRWHERHRRSEALADPDGSELRAAEDDLDG